MWGRKSKRRGAAAESPAAADSAPARPSASVTLRTMTPSEFEAFKAFMYEDYAAAIARGMGIPIEQARITATQQTDDLLKDGLASDTHRLWKIVAEGDGAVGDLWALVEPAKQQAFIYFIGIDEPQRGKGYARAALLALEAEARPLGIQQIGLNVFGDNTTARRLYESLGYQPAAITMRKEL